MSGNIRLVVVDDQTAVREALAVMLDLAEDVDVVATATNGQEALAVVAEHGPDVVLMDLNMPVMDGVEATGRIHADHPEATVVVLTTFEDDESIMAALQAGASGYLTKEADRATILQSVRSAAQGQTVLAPEVQRRLLTLATQRLQPAADPAPTLTTREREVLRLIGEGLRNREIAARLVISEATVKTHINNLFTKADLHSRADAVRYALSVQLPEVSATGR
ncbi:MULTISPECIES: response regulator [Streptomyces]|uniref:Response regulator transcription factor n=1 Tax=Streptomyces silvisoli TaxID=3034235 RepID=A0ABT5ZGG9_9ACTN|nr:MULTISPECIES: response regulator transcription factor [Streptomyces]MDF3288098.1 response regulator transcription factor [Streptomyces silvisoli]